MNLRKNLKHARAIVYYNRQLISLTLLTMLTFSIFGFILKSMNGYDLVENLRKTYPNIRSLFMSGYTANVIAQHGILNEKIQFLSKPFLPTTLLQSVRKALESEN